MGICQKDPKRPEHGIHTGPVCQYRPSSWKRLSGIFFAALLFVFSILAGCAAEDVPLETAGMTGTVSGAEEAGTKETAHTVDTGERGELLQASKADKTGSEETEDGPGTENTAEPVVLGDERPDLYLPLLEGKRIALFSNQSGIVGNRTIRNEQGTARAGAQKEDSKRDRIERDRSTEDPSAEDSSAEDPSPQEQAIWEGNRDPETEGLIPFGENTDGSDLVYGDHILDELIRLGVDVTVVFSPEHGFRGAADAGAQVEDSVDAQTGVPVVSLYGKGAAGPSAEDMDLFDVLVVDIQDVGLRYYTYYISMYHLMDACADAGKEVVILDRPNPNGFYVDGPVLRETFSSGVGILPIPVVHGMTLGELAQMINGEGWLSAGEDACHLTVVPCGNYTHQTLTSLVTRPSPNLKDMRAVYLYASTCFFENTAFSVGRGTESPFEIYGSPYLSAAEETDFSFVPVSMEGAQSPPFEGQVCYGKDLRGIPLEEILQGRMDLQYVIDARNALREVRPDLSFFGTPDGAGHYWIDYLCGTDQVRIMIEDGCGTEEIRASWQEEVEEFCLRRRPYLLYPE